MGFEVGGVGGHDPKSNISTFQISRGWHLWNTLSSIALGEWESWLNEKGSCKNNISLIFYASVVLLSTSTEILFNSLKH